MPITLLDGILIVVVLISAVLAMIRGFSREVLSIVSWLTAAVAALYTFSSGLFSGLVMQTLGDVINRNETAAKGIAALVVFLLVLIVVSYITMRIADFIIDSRIGALDRTLGFLFGAARGALLVIVTLMGFQWLAGDRMPDWIAEAKTRPAMEDIGETILDALPENLGDEIIKRVRPPEAPAQAQET